MRQDVFIATCVTVSESVISLASCNLSKVLESKFRESHAELCATSALERLTPAVVRGRTRTLLR